MKLVLTKLKDARKGGLTISLFKEVLWAFKSILVKVEPCTNYGNSSVYNDAYHFYDFLLTKETFKGDVKKQEQVLTELVQQLTDLATEQDWNLKIERTSIKEGYVLARVQLYV